MTRLRSLRSAAALLGIVAGVALTAPAHAEDTIKVGILHSLSGTMAISETTLKDVMLMLIDEQNKKGGLLGKKLEAVVVDPASNWPLFAEKARELITKDKVVGGVRLLDLGVAQIGAAGVQGARIRSCSIRCSTRARRASATSSTPAPRRTSRRSPPSTI